MIRQIISRADVYDVLATIFVVVVGYLIGGWLSALIVLSAFIAALGLMEYTYMRSRDKRKEVENEEFRDL